MRGKRSSRATVAVLVGVVAAFLPLGIPAEAATSLFGFPCSSGGSTTGDMNNDGYPDLAIGAPGDDVEQIEVDGSITKAGTDVGSINIVYSTSENGPDVTNENFGVPKFFAQNSAGVADDSQSGDNFGFSLASGNFDGRFGDDLAVGVPGENGGKGAVHILYSGAGLAGIGTLNDQLIGQDSNGIDGTGETNDNFGYAVAAGDFNRDGFSDLAVGAPRENISTRADAGIVHVIYGSSQGLAASRRADNTGRSDQVFEQGPGPVRNPEIARTESGDFFGAALAVGQFDGGGPVDLAIGSPGEDIGSAPDAGAVSVLYSNAAGTSRTGADFFHQGTPDLDGGPEAGDRFGCALAAGDFDGDHGRLANGQPTPAVTDDDEDLAIGAPGEAIGSDDDAGVVHAIYNTGRANGLAVNDINPGDNFHRNDQLWTENSDIPGVSKPNDRMGASLASADFDANKVDDLAIGLPTELLFTHANAGSVRVLSGFAGDGLDDTKRVAFGQSPSAPANNCWLYGLFDVCFAGPPDYSPLYMVEEEGDRFGASLAAADFDADGFGDLAIGAPGEDLGQLVNWVLEEQTEIPDELLTSNGIPVPLSIDEVEDAGVVHVVMGNFPEATATPAEQSVIYRDSGGSLNGVRDIAQLLLGDNEIEPADPVATSVLTGDAFGHDQS